MKKMDLAQEGLGRLMCRYALPCVVSLLVAALYNIVDQIFIANADYLGSYGNAANTVVFPATVFALAVAVMIGDGCCAFVSLCLGAKKRDDAGRAIGGAATLAGAAGIILTVIFLVFTESIITFFGAAVNEETHRLTREYYFWIVLGMPFYVFGQAMNPVIRADASPNFAMASTLAGAAANTVLDPIFIYVFRLGMMGAALATVLGQVITAAMAAYYLAHTKNVRLTAADFLPDRRISLRCLALGVCSMLAQVSLVAAMAATNNMLRICGARDAVFSQEIYAQIPMAVVGIVMKFFQIIISVSIGTAAGCIPIVGFNMGAGENVRVKRLFLMLIACEAAIGAVGFAVSRLFPMQLIAVFGAKNESTYYVSFALDAFRIYLSMTVLACVNKAAFIFLQAMGKPLPATALSMVREIVFGVGFALLLPQFFGLYGVLWSMPVSDVLTFVATLGVAAYTWRRLSLPAQSRSTRKCC